MHRYANPSRVMRLSRLLQPWLAGATVLLIAAGLYLALVASPPDYQQGESVRIMYVHVPAAWMAMFCYAALAGASAVGLIWKHPVADLAAKATAPIGASFTFLALVTGSLWGKPMWGTWWVWDARLTSVLVLFLFYLGYMALRASIDDEAKAGRAAAVLGLVGLINLPIVKFSVDWWNTLHQPASLLRAGGTSLDPAYLAPLLTMMAAYGMLFGAIWLTSIRTEVRRRRVLSLRARAAQEA